jgi:peptidyl-prolyl cis-trans isomerase C
MLSRHGLLVGTLICLAVIACSGNGQIATVDGRKITRAEFDAFVKFKRLNTQDSVKLKRIIDQYIEREALTAAIEKQGLLDKALLQAELNEFRKEMVIGRYFEKYLGDKVSEQAVRNYYNMHAPDFEARQVHVAHILIRMNKKMSEPERQAKLTIAQEALAKIRSGEDFAEIARRYSEDKVSAKKGGDLGWIKEGSIDARFSKVAFELKPGSVSDPFETPFGYHVVKVLEGPRTVKRPYELVAGDIRYKLRHEAKTAELKRLLSSIKVEKNEK